MKLLKLIPVVAAAALLAAPAMVRAEDGAPVTAQHQPGEGHGSGGERVGGFMQRIDKNKDGKISKDEFIAVQTERFTKMDKNNDGFLSREELRAAREMVSGKMHRRGDRPGKDGDNDGDGSLNE